MHDTVDNDLNSKTTKPSVKVAKIVAKISNIIKQEKVKFTPERVKKCCISMRDQLAVGKRITIKKESLKLYNENKDSAPDSPELKRSKDDLKEKLLLENREIISLSYNLLQKGEIESKVHKYISDFFN